MSFEKMKIILDKIKEYDSIMLFRHFRPDGDCKGSTMGLRDILRLSFPEKQIYLINDDHSDYLAFMGEEDPDVADEVYKKSLGIVLDTATAERIHNKKFALCKELIKIDHHIETAPYGNYSWVEDHRSSVCEMVAHFYNTFRDKSVSIIKRKDAIREELRFRKGDCLLNLFSDPGYLDMLAEQNRPMGGAGAADLDMFIRIFDMVRENSEIEEHNRYDEFSEEQAHDVFEEVMIGYFRELVEKQRGEELDVDILHAIKLQFRIRGDLAKRGATEEEKLRMNEAEEKLRELFGESCEVFRAATRIIDVHAKGVSKRRAARELQQRLGRKILVCVGDGENDVSMLRGADYAFAPTDGVVADRFENVCKCADGAVADVIYRKIPEILKK